MLVTEIDGDHEREVLTATITRSDFLARLATNLEGGPFRSDHANLVYSWCLDHYRKYGAAPDKSIRAVARTWAKTCSDQAQVRAVDRLLSFLSDEDKSNTHALDYLLDLSEALFNEIRLERLRDEIDAALKQQRLEVASASAVGYKRVDLHAEAVVDLLGDDDVVRKAIEERQRVLIKLPGAAGEFFGDELAEDSFVAFMAAAKGAKSFTLLHLAWMALRQHRRVAYFQIGDLSRSQIIQRFTRRAAYRPLKAGVVRLPSGITVPTDYKDIPNVEYTLKHYDEPIDWPLARSAFARVRNKSQGWLRMVHHPVRTVSIVDLQNTLNQWDREGFSANVVVIDYAGNLAPVDGRMATHEQVSLTWALMRQISETRKCLVLTANQANKEGFRSWVLTRNHFADSKMILAHATAFLGVNMTAEEKQAGVLRYNFVLGREVEWAETDCLYCATCLPVCNPMVRSTLLSKS